MREFHLYDLDEPCPVRAGIEPIEAGLGSVGVTPDGVLDLVELDERVLGTSSLDRLATCLAAAINRAVERAGR